MSAPKSTMPKLAKDLGSTLFFHELIAVTMGELGIKPAELARQSGIEEGTLSRLLGGTRQPTRRPRTQHVAALAEALSSEGKSADVWLDELNRAAAKTYLHWDQGLAA